MGALASLEDRPGRGRKPKITAEARAWLAELKARIMRYLQDLNSDPVVFRWRYKLEEELVS